MGDIGWKARAAALAAELVTQGALEDGTWAEAFAATPRHVFVPRVVNDNGAVLLAGQHKWLEEVYSDTALLTQSAPAGDGDQRLPTSSSSKPAVMAVMLDRLNLRDGHRVLEIGTGTGYHTALLCHRLGESDVYSLDIDPRLTKTARQHLAEIGYHPHLSTRDGIEGWPEHAPFDRIIATCAITHIPAEWIRQLTSDGRIVTPADAGNAGPLLILDKTAPDELTGHIDSYPAWFMPLREHASNPLGPGQSTGFTTTGWRTTAPPPPTRQRCWPRIASSPCSSGCTYPACG